MPRKKHPRIYLSPPHMGGTEKEYIREAFDTNWISPLGPNLDRFENQLSKYTGISHVSALSSGTAALHLALILCGVREGDYVICQSFTFCASVNPVVYLGANPVLVDSESATWNMDPELLDKAILSCMPRKPKAIIAVHLYGMPAQMKEIMEIADKYDIPVIEDAAEALGSTFNGKHVGSSGKLGILSFNGNKIITTSGGGAILSEDREAIDKAKFLSTQARDPAPHYQHTEIGYNYRMSNVLAGIGRGQMEVIDQRVKRKREIFNFYKVQLQDIPGFSFPEESGERFSNRWLTTVIIDPAKSRTTRQNLQSKFEKENIEARPLWKPMHLQPVYQNCPTFLNGVSEGLFGNGLCLPSGTAMSDEELSRILQVLKDELM